MIFCIFIARCNDESWGGSRSPHFEEMVAKAFVSVRVDRWKEGDIFLVPEPEFERKGRLFASNCWRGGGEESAEFRTSVWRAALPKWDESSCRRLLGACLPSVCRLFVICFSACLLLVLCWLPACRSDSVSNSNWKDVTWRLGGKDMLSLVKDWMCLPCWKFDTPLQMLDDKYDIRCVKK